MFLFASDLKAHLNRIFFLGELKIYTFQEVAIRHDDINYNCGEMSELAEGARLEIACTANRGTEGSNPSLSAIFFVLIPVFFPGRIRSNQISIK